MKQIVISNFQRNTALNKYDNISQCKNNPSLSSWKLDNRPESCDNVTSLGLFTFYINIFYGFLTPFLLIADSLFLKLTIHLMNKSGETLPPALCLPILVFIINV